MLWAKDGVEAIEMYKQYQPDLILMDVKMPRMDGLEARNQGSFVHVEGEPGEPPFFRNVGCRFEVVAAAGNVIQYCFPFITG